MVAGRSDRPNSRTPGLRRSHPVGRAPCRAIPVAGRRAGRGGAGARRGSMPAQPPNGAPPLRPNSRRRLHAALHTRLRLPHSAPARSAHTAVQHPRASTHIRLVQVPQLPAHVGGDGLLQRRFLVAAGDHRVAGIRPHPVGVSHHRGYGSGRAAHSDSRPGGRDCWPTRGTGASCWRGCWPTSA